MTLYDTLTKIERRIKNETITKVVKVSDGYVVFTCGYDGYTPLHEPYFFDRTLSISGFNMFDKANKEKLSAGKTVYKDSTPYCKGHKYGIRMDADNDGRERGGETTSDDGSGGGNTALPYGLCKKYGIELPKGATPSQAWEALKDKTGISADKAYGELEKSGTAQTITPETSSDKSEANPQPTAGKTEEYKPTKGEKKVATNASKLQSAKDDLVAFQNNYETDIQKCIDGSIDDDKIKEIGDAIFDRYHQMGKLSEYSDDEQEEYKKTQKEYVDLFFKYKDMEACSLVCKKAIHECQVYAKSNLTSQSKIDLIEQRIDKLANMAPEDDRLNDMLNKAKDECFKSLKEVEKQQTLNVKAQNAAHSDIQTLENIWGKVASSPLAGDDIGFANAPLGQVAVDPVHNNTIYVKDGADEWVNLNTGEIISGEDCYIQDMVLLDDKIKTAIIDLSISGIDDIIDSLNSTGEFSSYGLSCKVDYDVALEISKKYSDFKDKLEAMKKKKPKSPVKTKLTGNTLTKTHGCKHSDEAFTQVRKDDAIWCKTKDQSVEKFGSQAKRAYLAASSEQRHAAHNYTAGSGYINRPLNGFTHDWSKSYYKGIGNVDIDAEGGYHDMVALTDFLGKNEFDTDVWMQHGFTTKAGMLAFLGVDELTEEKIQAVIDSRADCHFPGFMSCGAAKGTGFANCNWMINVYAPKGTKGVYIAPGSDFGGDSSYNGEGDISHVGHENEILLQRDIHARATKFKITGGVVYVDVEITSQDPVEYSEVDDS